MDLWQLNVFCKVVELESFSKAGEAVHLSQPTVSSHIKDLEDHFDTRLIDRLSKKAVPTKAGGLLYDYARRLLSLREEAETAMAEFQGQIKGTLVIGGSTIPGEYLIPKIIGEFCRQYPEVYISLIIGGTRKIIQDTLSGKLELGIVGAKTDDKNILQNILIKDELSLIVPPSHPFAHKSSITMEELKDAPFIIRERGSGTLKSIQLRLKESGYELSHFKVIAEMGSTEAIRQAVKSGAGISILSNLAVAEDIRSGVLKKLSIEDLTLSRHFFLTVHKNRSTSPLCSVFTKFIQEQILQEGLSNRILST